MQCQLSCQLSSIVGPVFVVEAIVVLKKKSGGLRHISCPYIHNSALVKFIKHNKKTYQKLETHMCLEPSPCPHVPIPFHILMLTCVRHFSLVVYMQITISCRKNEEIKKEMCLGPFTIVWARFLACAGARGGLQVKHAKKKKKEKTCTTFTQPVLAPVVILGAW